MTLTGIYALFSGDLGYVAVALGPFLLCLAENIWRSEEVRVPWLAHAFMGLSAAPYLYFAPAGSAVRTAVWSVIAASALMVCLVAFIGRPRWLMPPAFRGPNPPARERFAAEVLKRTAWACAGGAYLVAAVWLLGVYSPPLDPPPGVGWRVLGLCVVASIPLGYAFAVGSLRLPLRASRASAKSVGGARSARGGDGAV